MVVKPLQVAQRSEASHENLDEGGDAGSNPTAGNSDTLYPSNFKCIVTSKTSPSHSLSM